MTTPEHGLLVLDGVPVPSTSASVLVELVGVGHGLAGEAAQGPLRQQRLWQTRAVGQEHLAQRRRVRGDREPRSRASAGCRRDAGSWWMTMTSAKNSTPIRTARPVRSRGRRSSASRGPGRRGCRVDVGELQQGRAEHVALAVRLLGHQAVRLQRLHDAVHRRGRQLEIAPSSLMPRCREPWRAPARAPRDRSPGITGTSFPGPDARVAGTIFAKPLTVWPVSDSIRHCRMWFASHGRFMDG
jgi:hypothetical protein